MKDITKKIIMAGAGLASMGLVSVLLGRKEKSKEKEEADEDIVTLDESLVTEDSSEETEETEVNSEENVEE